MKENIRVIIFLALVIIVAGILIVWQTNKHSFQTLYPEEHLLFAFASALQMNDPRAYDMIDPNLKPRLDTWMSSHKRQECNDGELISSFIWEGTNLGEKVTFSCFTETSILDFEFEVDDIVIKDLQVIDWGEVIEKIE